jgi:hypothetical protein
MVEPITTGALVAGALSAGAGALAKGALGQAGKEAYTALKNTLLRWAGNDVEQLEARPDSDSRKAVIAETIDEKTDEQRSELAALAESLVAALRKDAVAHGPTGIDIGKLDAMEVQLGQITARTGTGFKAAEVKTSGVFRADKIETGETRSGN